MTVLRGTVFDRAGQPVPEASVYFVSAPVAVRDVAALTGNDGSFTLVAPAPGDYRVGARAAGYAPGELAITVTSAPEQDARIELKKE